MLGLAGAPKENPPLGAAAAAAVPPKVGAPAGRKPKPVEVAAAPNVEAVLVAGAPNPENPVVVGAAVAVPPPKDSEGVGFVLKRDVLVKPFGDITYSLTRIRNQIHLWLVLVVWAHRRRSQY